jgi:hypothetical protein
MAVIRNKIQWLNVKHLICLVENDSAVQKIIDTHCSRLVWSVQCFNVPLGLICQLLLIFGEICIGISKHC